MLSSMQGTDALGDGTFSSEKGGMIKAYNNTMVDSGSVIYTKDDATSFDAYLATTRDEEVSSSYVTVSGGTCYNNFDTKVDLGVTATQIQSPEAAKETVLQYAGRMQHGDFSYTFDNSVADTSYAIDTTLAAKLAAYTNGCLEVQGIGQISSGDSGSEETPATGYTAAEVVALIEALPEAASVTSSNSTAIKTARTAYNSLSSDDQAAVTNLSKLTAAEEALAALPQAAVTCTFTASGASDSSFTTSGSFKKVSDISTGATYSLNGTSLSYVLKMDSAGSCTFTLTADSTVTVVASTKTAGKQIYVGTEILTLTTSAVEYELSLKAGTYTIKQVSGESYLFAVIVG